MVCSNCKEFRIFLNLEEFIVSKSPNDAECIEYIYSNLVEIAKKDFNCCKCGSKVIKGESYIVDYDELSDTIYRYNGKLVMGHIDYCTECDETSTIQDIFPSLKSRDSKDKTDSVKAFNEIDTSRTISDIIYTIFDGRLERWESHFKAIASYTKCPNPNCKNGSGEDYDDQKDYGIFNLGTSVYTTEDIDQFNSYFNGNELVAVKNEISEIAKNFTIDELDNIKNSYIQSKIFISRHQGFLKLEEFIKSLYQQQIYYELAENRLIFRTRISIDDIKLNKSDLWEPPYASASHGRYNDIGTSILYCANNRDVIKKEIIAETGTKHNIAKFILHEPMYLFPINYIFEGDFEGLISEEVSVSDQLLQFKQQYILSNIVSAICYNVGYDGIVFRSTKDKISINYGLFSKYKKYIDIDILDIE